MLTCSTRRRKARAKGYRNLKTATMHKGHDLVLYQVQQTEWYEAPREIYEPLKIDLAKMHGRSAAVSSKPASPPAPAWSPPSLVLLKNFVRALAQRQGKCVTFMPRWTEDADNQSIHLHVSLMDRDGGKVFHDPVGRNGMSRRPSVTSSAACRNISAT